MGYVIEQRSGATPLYYSEQAGRNIGSPLGAWVSDISKATVYATQGEADEMLAGKLQWILDLIVRQVGREVGKPA